MKNAIRLTALLVLFLGLNACESDNSLADAEALYEAACDTCNDINLEGDSECDTCNDIDLDGDSECDTCNDINLEGDN